LQKGYALLAVLLFYPILTFSQVAPAAKGGTPPLTVGGYYSNFAPDYGPNRLGGLGVYVDWDLFGRLGAEGETRFLRFHQSAEIHEDNYLVGPRYTFRYGPIRPYVKFLMGAGELNFYNSVAHGGYFAMAPGAGVDYRLDRKWSVRGDYEFQIWPGAPGLPGLPSHGLTPQGFSVGVGYRIF
jgi:opacity protein-like surface antigen